MVQLVSALMQVAMGFDIMVAGSTMQAIAAVTERQLIVSFCSNTYDGGWLIVTFVQV